MNDNEMRVTIRAMVGEAVPDNVLSAYMKNAKSVIIERMYPYKANATWEDVPEKHHMRMCDIACYMINKRGAEGETAHSESGVSRTYESAEVPASMLYGIVPHVGVPR